MIIHLRQSLGPTAASIGIATFPADGDHSRRVLAVADAGLYRAKAPAPIAWANLWPSVSPFGAAAPRHAALVAAGHRRFQQR